MIFDYIAQVAWFIFLGLLGGVSYVMVNGKSWEDLGTFESCKRYILGGVIGLLYTILYSDHNFPNSIMCWVAGYSGTSFIEALMKKFGPQE